MECDLEIEEKDKHIAMQCTVFENCGKDMPVLCYK